MAGTNKSFTRAFEGNRPNLTAVDLLGDNEQSFVICAYTLLFTIAACGNLAIFVTLIRTGRKKSRVNLMMLHLSLADLIVTFILMPTEIFWRITQQWLAGNFLCKFLFMMRAFGLYLSSNILICISFDRYFAVIHPLRVSAARKRSKLMLSLAWLVACFCSLPQVLVFHVEVHPNVTDFKQCVSFNYFSSMEYETVYNMSCLSAMYFIPLLVIICTYSRIFLEINMNSRDIRDDSTEKRGEKCKMRLRRSDLRLMQRARSRTLRLTLNIVLVFLICGMPYAVMTTYYMFNVEAAKKVDIRIQEVCFLMVASNSCMNPLVYGTYIINLKRIIWKAVNCFFCGKKTSDAPDKSIVGSALSKSSLRVKTMQTQREKVKVREVYKLKSLHKNFAPPPDEPSTFHSGIQSEPPLRTQCDSEFCVVKLTAAKSWENFDYWSATRTVR